jgi:hypothetical protein
MCASNTRDCFRAFVGQKVIGLLFNALPVNRRELAAGNKTLVFDDGRGLTIAANGSFWIDSADDVQRAIVIARNALHATQAELADVLALAGDLEAR